MTVPLPSTESHRWQSEIQLWCAYEEWLLSAELCSYYTSGSMCWIISASIRLVQCVTMRRNVCELPSALLQHWSDLHEPLSIAKTVGAGHQQSWKRFSGRKLLLPVVIKAQRRCPLAPMKGPFVPNICNGIALQAAAPLWEMRGTLLNWQKKGGIRGAGCEHAKVMSCTKVTPQVTWEESKGERLAEAGELRDVNWEVGRKAGGWWTSDDQTQEMKGQRKNVLRAFRNTSVSKYRLFLTMKSQY